MLVFKCKITININNKIGFTNEQMLVYIHTEVSSQKHASFFM